MKQKQKKTIPKGIPKKGKMSHAGLTKLIEECGELQKELGELIQVCAKQIAYSKTDVHPDKAGSLRERLQNEISDVLGCIKFCTEKFELNENQIKARKKKKYDTFMVWDAGK